MTINLTWIRNIYEPVLWPLVLFILMPNFVQKEVYFIVSIMVCFIFIYKNNKILIPKIKGLSPYLVFLIYATLLGMISCPIRYVIRDAFYIVPNIIIIFIGYWSKKSYSKKSIMATLAISAFFISISCFCRFVISFSQMNTMGAIRDCFGTRVYDVGIGFAILLVSVIYYKRTLITKKMDIVMLMATMLQIIISLGRAAMLEGFIVFTVGTVVSLYSLHNKQKVIKKWAVISIVVTIAFIGIFRIIPDEVSDEFIEKWNNNWKEINSEQQIDDTSTAMQNWRAYEIQSAKKNWKDDNIVGMVFGNGLGKGTKVDFIPYSWRKDNFIINNELMLLHNCYYTILAKGGIFGVAAIIWIFLGSIWFGLKKIKQRRGLYESCILITISMAFMVIGYLVRGIVAQDTSPIWALAVGSLNYALNQAK